MAGPLDTRAGKTGLFIIDAIPEFAADYATNRPKTTFVAMFASDRDGDVATLYEPDSAKRIASNMSRSLLLAAPSVPRPRFTSALR